MKKRRQFHCTGLLRSSNLVHLDGKKKDPKFQNYPKFSAKFNELSLKFSKRQEVAKKCLKQKQSRKPLICGIRGLGVKSESVDDTDYQNKNEGRGWH